jgi:two-component system OmpR family response regulator
LQTRPVTVAKRVVFIVDDEPEIGNLLLDAMTQFDMDGKVFATAGEMLTALGLEDPDACIVDLGLPDMEGMALINEIRRRSSVPIIVLSARGHSTDRVMGLELGADDYVVKPFDPREVVARIRSILRRSTDPVRQQAREDFARFEGWSYQPSSHCLTSPEGEETFLSTGEATLLEALLRAPKTGSLPRLSAGARRPRRKPRPLDRCAHLAHPQEAQPQERTRPHPHHLRLRLHVHRECGMAIRGPTQPKPLPIPAFFTNISEPEA